MGNVIYGNRLSCFETIESCAQACARFECVYVDKCDGGSSLHYVCLPFDSRFFMWLLLGLFLLVVLGCSSIVVCYAIRAIRTSFRHALVTENDIVFYNANVHTFPHPAQMRRLSNQSQFAPYNNQCSDPNFGKSASTPNFTGLGMYSGLGVVPYPKKAPNQQRVNQLPTTTVLMRNTPAAKIILTPNGTVIIPDSPSSSVYGYNSTPTASARNSLYLSLGNDDFESTEIDEFNAVGKIQIDDELHLIGDGTNTPWLRPKAVAMLVANFIFVLTAATWLIICNYQFDIISTIFIALTLWALIANLLMAYRTLRRIREHSTLIGKPSEFRDYVQRVNNPMTPINIQNNADSSYYSVNRPVLV